MLLENADTLVTDSTSVYMPHDREICVCNTVEFGDLTIDSIIKTFLHDQK